MTEQSAAELAAETILRERAQAAAAITAAMYQELPELLNRYGQRGRERCLEDMHFNLEHLAAAVALDAPEVFVNYVRWADDLLRARQVPTVELVRCLELMRGELRGRMEAPEAEVVNRCIQAALRAVEEDGRR